MAQQTENPDVIVIGGGTAGCVVAARLAERGRQVLLIEAGPDYGPRGSTDWPEELLNAASLPTSHDWGYTGPGGSGHLLALDRCRVIGGCSTHNGTTQNVGWAGDYDAWAAAGAVGWDAASLGPLFAEALHKFEARSYDESEVQPFHRAVIDAAVADGLPVVADFDQLDGGAGVGCAPVSSTPEGIRINASFAYLDELRDGGNLTVIASALVNRIRFEGPRAVGVEIIKDDEVWIIDAPLVVLSGGTYGSPEVLLRSGVGPADQLRAQGIPLTLDLPGVGENLQDQPTAQMEFEGTTALEAELAVWATHGIVVEEQTIVKLRSSFAGEAPYDLHVYPWVERDESMPHTWKVVIPVALLRPRSRGAVRLASADPNERAVIETGYLEDPRDSATLAFGLGWVENLVRSPALSRFIGRPLLAREADENVADWLTSQHQHYWHPTGTCRMGPASDARAVVDATGRVHGLSGLYIADASVFPDVPRGTTALPTAVVGERIARFILEASALDT